MRSEDVLAVFLLSLLHSAVPGPAMLLTAARTAAGGLRQGLLSMTGILCARLLLGATALAAIAEALTLPARTLALLEWLGAALLLWIALRLFRATPAGTRARGSRSFAEALVLGLVNPVNLLFCLVILPQVLPPGQLAPGAAGMLLAALILGAFCAQAVAVLAGLGALGAPALRGRAAQRLGGLVLAGFALFGLAAPLHQAGAYPDHFHKEEFP